MKTICPYQLLQAIANSKFGEPMALPKGTSIPMVHHAALAPAAPAPAPAVEENEKEKEKEKETQVEKKVKRSRKSVRPQRKLPALIMQLKKPKRIPRACRKSRVVGIAEHFMKHETDTLLCADTDISMNDSERFCVCVYDKKSGKRLSELVHLPKKMDAGTRQFLNEIKEDRPFYITLAGVKAFVDKETKDYVQYASEVNYDFDVEAEDDDEKISEEENASVDE